MTTRENIPAQEIDAECCTLGAAILDNNCLDLMRGTLEPHDFYRESHRTIYAAMLAMRDAGLAIDLVTLKSELIAESKLERCGGVAYLVALIESVPSASNWEHYARLVQGASVRRRLADAGRKIEQLARADDDPSDLVNRAAALIDALRGTNDGSLVMLKSILRLEHDRFERIAESGPEPVGVMTGLSELDCMTDGLGRGDLTLVAGRPSAGKSSLAFTMARGAARGGVRTLIFTLENRQVEAARRFLSLEAKIAFSKLRRGVLTDDEYTAATEAIERLYRTHILLCDRRSITVPEMRGYAMRAASEFGALDLVMVDYLQLIKPHTRAGSRNEEVSAISRELKIMAGDLDLPVVALSQLSRASEQTKDGRPTLIHLRDSGSLEQDADHVMFVHRPEQRKAAYARPRPEQQEEVELIVAKQRNGPIGTVKLWFFPYYTLFRSQAQEGR